MADCCCSHSLTKSARSVTTQRPSQRHSVTTHHQPTTNRTTHHSPLTSGVRITSESPFVCSNGMLCVVCCCMLYVCCVFVCLFVRSSVRPSVRAFVRSFVRAFVRACVRSCLRSCLLAFVVKCCCPFSFVCSFVAVEVARLVVVVWRSTCCYRGCSWSGCLLCCC